MLINFSIYTVYCSLHTKRKYCFLRHGDMVYLVESVPSDNGENTGSSIHVPSTSHSISNEAIEDPVDIFLSKQDGLIYREKDPQL